MSEQKTLSICAQQFENLWLSRYPPPVQCRYNPGFKFMGHHESQSMLNAYNITSICQPTAVKNAQANAICEKLHQTVANTLCPLIHAHPPEDVNGLMMPF